MDYLVSFGDWLRQRRESLDLTRAELAHCAGCSVSALRKIEADERRPSRQLGELLAACLEISPEQRTAFLDAARGLQRVEQLGSPPGTATRSYPGTPSAGPAWNLPAPVTPLLGREAELATLKQLLADPACRLLTLVGPGGIGKTRLGIELACLQWERFADGVFFSSLAATSSSEFMVPVISRAIGLHFSGSSEPRRQIVDYLSTRQALLLLDNLEHLLKGVDLLVELLEKAPAVKLLVTSRERLELQGEWVFEVQGLPVPDAGEMLDLEKYSSVRLFVQRARQARIDFQLSSEDGAHVARICQLVEGMPLAIELAATWAPMLSCQEIATEIERSIDFLSTTMRDLPERQRSIRATFDYSWKLLTEEERRVLRRLAVFRGGFPREAVQEVVGASLPLLSALVAKSFLRRTADGRYGIHELVRQYVAERLAGEDTEQADARRRHSSYYTAFVAGWEGELKGARQAQALAALDDEIDNIRVGWRWAIEQGQEAAIVRYINTMMPYYEIRGWHEEAVQVCERVLSAMKEWEAPEAPQLAARAQAYQAAALQNLGRLAEARQLLEESLAQAQALGAKEDIAHALVRLGSGAIFAGAADVALSYFDQALELYVALDDHYGQAWALQSLGWATLNLEQVDLAQQYHHRTLPLLHQHGPQNLLVWTLFELGGMARERGDYEEAQAYLEEAKCVAEEIGYHFALLSCLLGLGQTAEAVGRYRRAQRYYRRAVDLQRQVGLVTDVATCLALLVRAALASADDSRAENHLRELQTFVEKTSNQIARGCYQYASGEFALSKGRLDEAEMTLQQSVSSLRPTRRRAIALLSMLSLGQLYWQLGDEDRAEAQFQNALREARDRSSAGMALEAVMGIATVLAKRGDGEQALELATLVHSKPATTWKARQQAATLQSELKEVLGEECLARAAQQDPDRPLQTVIADLLGE